MRGINTTARAIATTAFDSKLAPMINNEIESRSIPIIAAMPPPLNVIEFVSLDDGIRFPFPREIEIPEIFFLGIAKFLIG